MWSLGVVLYELMALELPFQASSLPALVHHICTQGIFIIIIIVINIIILCVLEPNYSIVEGHYTNEIISLCKSMLQKSPGIIIIIIIIIIVISIIIINLTDKRPTVQELYETRFIKRHLSDHLSYTIIDSSDNRNPDPVTRYNRTKEIEKLRKFRQDMANKRGTSINNYSFY